MTRIEVAVAAPLLQTLSYSFDPDANGNPVGRRVLVPLGRQRVTGYVLALLPEEDVSYRIFPVLQFLDKEALFPENLVSFFRWIADYYHHPIGEVVRTALPGGLTSRNRKIIQLTPVGKEKLTSWPQPNTSEPEWFTRLLDKGELSPALTGKVSADKQWRKLLADFNRNGLICYRESLAESKIREKLEQCYVMQTPLELPESIEGKEGRKALAAAAKQEGQELLTIPLVRTLFHLSSLSREQGQEAVSAKDLRRVYSGASKSLVKLEGMGLVCSTDRRIYRDPFGETLPFLKNRQGSVQSKTRSLVRFCQPSGRKLSLLFFSMELPAAGRRRSICGRPNLFWKLAVMSWFWFLKLPWLPNLRPTLFLVLVIRWSCSTPGFLQDNALINGALLPKERPGW